jgi:hypothetical protein
MFVAVPEDKKQPISQLEDKIKSQPGEKKILMRVL